MAWSTVAWAEAICALADAIAPARAPCAFTDAEAAALTKEAWAAVNVPPADWIALTFLRISSGKRRSRLPMPRSV